MTLQKLSNDTVKAIEWRCKSYRFTPWKLPNDNKEATKWRKQSVFSPFSSHLPLPETPFILYFETRTQQNKFDTLLEIRQNSWQNDIAMQDC